MHKRIILFSALLSATCALSMDEEQAKKIAAAQQPVDSITIDGITKPLYHHYLDAVTGSGETPFSTTALVHYANNRFTSKGDLYNATDSDIQAMMHGNYVYLKVYRQQRTRLSDGQPAVIGAIILGTKDPKMAERLHIYAMHQQLADAKKEKEESEATH